MTDSPRILVVDDSNTTRKILRKILGEAGHSRVEEAADGNEAWVRLTDPGAGFSVVFCDWHMPGLDGLQLLERIRNSELLQTLPVIMTTAERKREEVERAVTAGATWYVVKPFDPDTIRRALAKALDGAHSATAT